MVEKQVLYMGRWVPKEHFRVFVHNETGQKLANSHEEFTQLISSGLWFVEKPEPVEPTKRGRKCQSQPKA